jgi:hypothetical protein
LFKHVTVAVVLIFSDTMDAESQPLSRVMAAPRCLDYSVDKDKVMRDLAGTSPMAPWSGWELVARTFSDCAVDGKFSIKLQYRRFAHFSTQ